MRQWIPLMSSPKGRLVLAAVRQFGALPFDEVTVGGLAAEAEVTTGAIYHHFGSKQGLYEFVRADVEQRLLDRMAGAIQAGGPESALRVGFDFAVSENFERMLGAGPVSGELDRVAELLAVGDNAALGRIVAAAWRASLLAAADGIPAAEARAAISRLAILPAPVLPAE